MAVCCAEARVHSSDVGEILADATGRAGISQQLRCCNTGRMILLLSRACDGTRLCNFLCDAKFESQADCLPNGVNKLLLPIAGLWSSDFVRVWCPSCPDM